MPHMTLALAGIMLSYDSGGRLVVVYGHCDCKGLLWLVQNSMCFKTTHCSKAISFVQNTTKRVIDHLNNCVASFLSFSLVERLVLAVV